MEDTNLCWKYYFNLNLFNVLKFQLTEKKKEYQSIFEKYIYHT
jgi:hypothetical protein